MDFTLRPWQFCFLILDGWVSRQRQLVIKYRRTVRLSRGRQQKPLAYVQTFFNATTIESANSEADCGLNGG